MLKTRLSDYFEAAPKDLYFYSLTADSREVKKGSLFIAIRGLRADGGDFTQEALKKGALAVVGEDPRPSGFQAPYFQVKNARHSLAELAALFYEYPSRAMKVLAVTGTSGKTSCSFLLESILSAAGEKVGLIGTIMLRFNGQERPALLTTPGPVELQRSLYEMKQAGCTAVVMEVSSHALKQGRVDGTAFDGMLFTNLSPEHLDFHKNMEDYLESKAMLFKRIAWASKVAGKTPSAVIHTDCSTDHVFGQRLFSDLLQDFPSQSPFQRLEQVGAWQDLKLTAQGCSGVFRGLALSSPLVGTFNAENIASATALSLSLAYPPAAIKQGIAQLKGIPGRLEKIQSPGNYNIWVDYAHKPGALKCVLETLRLLQTKGGRIITVFGCGGDRDREKRPLMGKIAALGSDLLWVTSDNPRSEPPNKIAEDILLGIKNQSHVHLELDRARAIHAALAELKKDDFLLIAGKGHENYQILGKERIIFSDAQCVRDTLAGIFSDA